MPAPSPQQKSRRPAKPPVRRPWPAFELPEADPRERRLSYGAAMAATLLFHAALFALAPILEQARALVGDAPGAEKPANHAQLREVDFLLQPKPLAPKPKPQELPQWTYVETNPEAPQEAPTDSRNVSSRNQRAAQPNPSVSPENDRPTLDGDNDEVRKIVRGDLRETPVEVLPPPGRRTPAPQPKPSAPETPTLQQPSPQQPAAVLQQPAPAPEPSSAPPPPAPQKAEEALLNRTPLADLGTLSRPESKPTREGLEKGLEDAPTHGKSPSKGESKDQPDPQKPVKDRTEKREAAQMSPLQPTDKPAQQAAAAKPSAPTPPSPQPQPQQQVAPLMPTQGADTPAPRERKMVTRRASNGPLMKSRGAASRMGAVGVDANFSEFGGYVERMLEAIEARWNQLGDRYGIAGEVGTTVQIVFKINAKGEVTDYLVKNSSASRTGTLICQDAILSRAPFGEWTLDMIRVLGDEQTVTITFHYL